MSCKGKSRSIRDGVRSGGRSDDLGHFQGFLACFQGLSRTRGNPEMTKIATDIDKVNEVTTSQCDFSFVDSVDADRQSLVDAK